MVTSDTPGMGALGSENSRVHALAHRSSDVDSERGSLHHTLGKGPTQAAPGNHRHIGTVITYAVTPPVGTLDLDGSVINYADYPDYFRFLGLTSGTYTLPDFTGMELAVVVRE